jgi:hypothetical protein
VSNGEQPGCAKPGYLLHVFFGMASAFGYVASHDGVDLAVLQRHVIGGGLETHRPVPPLSRVNPICREGDHPLVGHQIMTAAELAPYQATVMIQGTPVDQA